jgi:senataxin
LSNREKPGKVTNSKYNISQNEALKYVSAMQSGSLSLIQGPPGTGKTHTVVGIIDMIMHYKFNKGEKILMCTPSNAA